MKEDLVGLFGDLFNYVLVWSRICDKRQPPYSEVRAKVKGLLEEQFAKVTREGWSTENYKAARFAVCAWVDEIIMNSNWDHRSQWQSELLQTEFYRTTNAGEEFFDRLEQLYPEQKSVREVYYICLALGFRGRYAWEEDRPRIQELMRHHFGLLPEPRIEVRDLDVERIAPEAYPDQEPASAAPAAAKTRAPISRSRLIALAAVGPVLFAALWLVYNFILNGILGGVTV